MKNLIRTFIVIFSLIAIGLVFLLVYALSQGGKAFTFNNYDVDLVNTQSIPLEDINTITITYHSDDVLFFTSDTDEIILKEYMNTDADIDEYASFQKNGNELIIKGGNDPSNFFVFGFSSYSGNTRAEIYLPTNYAEKINVTTSSGNINSDLTLTLSEFEATSTSGDIYINEVYADNIKADASSGNITFDVAEGSREISASSGDIKVLGGTGDSNITTSSGNITVENSLGIINAEASSGDIKIIDHVGGADIETKSGNTKLYMNDVTDDIDINVSSGDATLIIPNTTSFNFSCKTSSGDISTFFDDMLSYDKDGEEASGTVGENPICTIQINAHSGNISVNEK